MRLDNEQLSGRNGKQAGMRVRVEFEGTLDRVADVMCVRVNGHTYALPDSAELHVTVGPVTRREGNLTYTRI